MTTTQPDGAELMNDASDLFGRAFPIGNCPGCNLEAELVRYPFCWLCGTVRDNRRAGAEQYAARQCWDKE